MHLPPLVLFGLPITLAVLEHCLLGGRTTLFGSGPIQASIRVIKMFSMELSAVFRFWRPVRVASMLLSVTIARILVGKAFVIFGAILTFFCLA